VTDDSFPAIFRNPVQPFPETGTSCDAVGEEKNADHHGPEANVQDLLCAAARICGADERIHFGPEWEKWLPSIRLSQVVALNKEPLAEAPDHPPTFTGGEHDVFECEEGSAIIKRTLCGFYGRIMDEKNLLDSAIFQNRRQLFLRSALPSEYLRRWALLSWIFGVPTTYLGHTQFGDTDLRILVHQPYIEQEDADPATLEDVSDFMLSHQFARVEDRKIAVPEVKEVTWYRQSDGVLITDAHARNFRKATDGSLVPVDLMVSLVPKGTSTLLPDPISPWSLSTSIVL
jgi:hypothetical protein